MGSAVRIDLPQLLLRAFAQDLDGFHNIRLRDREPELGASAVGVRTRGAEDVVVDACVIQEPLLRLDFFDAALGDDLCGRHGGFVCHVSGGSV